MPALFTLLILTYPLAVHLSISLNNVRLAVFYLSALMLAPIVYHFILRSKISRWHFFAATGAVLFGLSAIKNDTVLIKLLPLSINSILFWFFAVSLTRDHIPLITRFAGLMRADMPAPVMTYTRKATIAWAMYFLVMALMSALLALFSPLPMWSFFSNISSYVLLPLMFTVEFMVRKSVLGGHIDYTFVEFLQRLRRINFSRELQR